MDEKKSYVPLLKSSEKNNGGLLFHAGGEISSTRNPLTSASGSSMRLVVLVNLVLVLCVVVVGLVVTVVNQQARIDNLERWIIKLDNSLQSQVPVETHSPAVNSPRVHRLPRSSTGTCREVEAILGNYCDHRNKTGTGPLETSHTQYARYEGRFYSLFNDSQFASSDGSEIIIKGPKKDSRLAEGVSATKTCFLTYTKAGEPLAFYNPREGSGDLLTQAGDNNNTFSVKVEGRYLISVNISLVDYNKMSSSRRQYIGLTINGRVVMTCYNNTFRCGTNQDDDEIYKICNMIGVFILITNDQLQLQTMEPNISIRLEDHRTSQFIATRL